jgi:hypothetical protein
MQMWVWLGGVLVLHGEYVEDIKYEEKQPAKNEDGRVEHHIRAELVDDIELLVDQMGTGALEIDEVHCSAKEIEAERDREDQWEVEYNHLHKTCLAWMG